MSLQLHINLSRISDAPSTILAKPLCLEMGISTVLVILLHQRTLKGYEDDVITREDLFRVFPQAINLKMNLPFIFTHDMITCYIMKCHKILTT
jgi:hypothetical protein